MKLKSGMKVKGCIFGKEMIGAIQGIGEKWYFCQDVRNGASCGDNLGYKYSWRFRDIGGEYTEGVSDLRPLSPTNIENIYEGAFVDRPDRKGKRKVLGICGEVIFLSDWEAHNAFDVPRMYTVAELKKNGYKLVPDDVRKVTMEEVREKFGEDVVVKEES